LEKVEVICKEHGSFFSRPNSLYYGKGCPECARVATVDRLLSYGTTLDSLKKEMGALYPDMLFKKIDSEFTNSHGRITITCPTHGDSLVGIQSLKRKLGNGCPKCGFKLRNKHKIVTADMFLSMSKTKHNNYYDYSKTQFTALSDNVTITCPKHGDFVTNAGGHYRGYGCKKCADENTGIKRRPLEDDLRRKITDIFPQHSFIKTTYDSGISRTTMVCTKHGEFTAATSALLSGKGGCWLCGVEKRGVDNVVPFSTFVERAREVHGHTYDYFDTDYVGTNGPVTINCKKHGLFTQRGADHISKGCLCPACATTKDSKPQVEIDDFIKLFGVDTVRNYKFGEGKHELDIFIPDMNIGIEYNGIYFHSERFKTGRSSDFDKTTLAEKEGVRVIHIFSDEWQFNNLACRKYIMNILGVNRKTSIYARKCNIAEIDNTRANDFYDTYHIQGHGRPGINLALTYDGEIAAVMSFTKLSSGRTQLASGTWELSRFASSRNVVGGASRLFKHLVQKNSATCVVSFSDNRLFKGVTYAHLGFTKSRVLPPDYKYVNLNGNMRLNKSKFQHKHLPKVIGDSYNPSLSEKENCENNGYYRIYDSGLTKWVWKKENPA